MTCCLAIRGFVWLYHQQCVVSYRAYFPSFLKRKFNQNLHTSIFFTCYFFFLNVYTYMGSLICVYRREGNSCANVMRRKSLIYLHFCNGLNPWQTFCLQWLIHFYFIKFASDTLETTFLKHALSLNILFLFQFINFVTIQITFFGQIQL